MPHPALKKPKVGADRPNLGNAGKGRPKGSVNKLTGDVRAMILAALTKAGGERYLLTQATENPTAFMTLVGKVLPKEITGEGGAPLFPSTINVIGIKPQ